MNDATARSLEFLSNECDRLLEELESSRLRIKELEKLLNHAEEGLRRIAEHDHRGNRTSDSIRAYYTLESLKEMKAHSTP